MHSILMLALLGGLFGVSGNGTIKVEARPVGEFHALSVAAGSQVRKGVASAQASRRCRRVRWLRA